MEYSIKITVEGDYFRLDLITDGATSPLYYHIKLKKDLLKEIKYQVNELWRKR